MDKNKQQTINPGLYLVSTPIGNMEDITFRALNVLKKSDIILCEDTRRSGKLLSYFKIKNKLLSYHKFNEKKVSSKIIDSIKILCNSLKISFYYKLYSKGKKSYSIKSIYRCLPFMMQGFIYLTYYIMTRWPISNIQPTIRFGGKSSIFIFLYFTCSQYLRVPSFFLN